MKDFLKTVFALTLLVWSPEALAVKEKIICPTEIAQTSIKLTNIPQRWQSYVASPLYLSSAGATAGPPEQLATLMGDSTWKKGSTDWRTTYDLDDDSFIAGKWMECRYGEYGQVTLSTPLDDKTKSCTVRLDKGEKAGQRSIKIDCD